MAKKKTTTQSPACQFGMRNIELENGTFRYEIALDGIPVLISKRTFLTMEECLIERDWVSGKLGCVKIK